MIKPLLDHSGFKWMAGGLLLGAVLGICFTILLRPGTGGFGGAEPDSDLLEGLAMSRQLTQEGKGDDALKLLESLIERYPENPEPYNNLAALQASRGQLETSRELLEKALRTNEGYAAIYENLGVVYSEIARTSYGKALRLELPPSAPQLKVLSHVAPTGTMARAEVPPRSATTGSAPAGASSRAGAPAQTPAVPVSSPARKPAPVQAEAQPQAPAAAPPVQQGPDGPKGDQQEQLRTLHAWAKAWSDKDVSRYLSFYGSTFRPEGGMSRQTWEGMRKRRITSPAWIKVDLEKINLTPSGPDTVEVTLIQDYRADSFRDRTRKAMVLVREGDAWRIQSETQGRPR